MTAPDTLDRRAREAVAAAHESVALLRPPGIEPRSGRTRVLVLGGLVAATLLLVAGIVFLGDDDSDTRTVDDPPTEPDPAPDAEGETPPDADGAAATPAGVMPRLEVVPPEGYVLSALEDTPSAPASAQRLYMELYGAGPADDPFAAGDVMVFSFPGDRRAAIDDAEGPTIVVRGRDGVASDGFAGFGLAGEITWLETPELTVLLASRHLDDDELIILAEDLETAGAAMTWPDPPGPTRQVSAGEVDPSLGVSMLAGGWTQVWTDGPGGETITLAAGWGDTDDQLMGRFLASSDEPATVAGVDARRLTLSTAGGTTLIWPHGDDVILSLTVSDPELDLVPLAEQIVAADDPRWAEMRAEAAGAWFDHTLGENEELVSGSTEIDDDLVLWLLHDDGAATCLDVRAPDGSSMTCRGRGNIPADQLALTADAVGRADQPPTVVVVFGAVGSDIHEVRLERQDGTFTLVPAFVAAGGGPRAVALVLPYRDDATLRAVGLDIDGETVTTEMLTVVLPGADTGDHAVDGDHATVTEIRPTTTTTAG